MEQAYRLSAGALLYAVLKLHKPGIYGLPTVMPKLSDKDFPAFAQDAELELMDAGCGILSFDGEFALDESFAALLGSCADCRGVVGASLRRDGVWGGAGAGRGLHLHAPPGDTACGGAGSGAGAAGGPGPAAV